MAHAPLSGAHSGATKSLRHYTSNRKHNANAREWRKWRSNHGSPPCVCVRVCMRMTEHFCATCATFSGKHRDLDGLPSGASPKDAPLLRHLRHLRHCLTAARRLWRSASHGVAAVMVGAKTLQTAPPPRTAADAPPALPRDRYIRGGGAFMRGRHARPHRLTVRKRGRRSA